MENSTPTPNKCLDPSCPCQDGDPCHYLTYADSIGHPIPTEYMKLGERYTTIVFPKGREEAKTLTILLRRVEW